MIVNLSLFCAMSDERWNALMNDPQAILTKEEMEQGWHWCYDFDGLLVGPGMGEQQHCHCKQA